MRKMAYVFIFFVLSAGICLPSFAEENAVTAIKIVISGEIAFISAVEKTIIVKKVSEASEDKLEQYKIDVPQDAEITKDGAVVKFEDLMEGDNVTVNTKFEGNIFTAESITVN